MRSALPLVAVALSLAGCSSPDPPPVADDPGQATAALLASNLDRDLRQLPDGPKEELRKSLAASLPEWFLREPVVPLEYYASNVWQDPAGEGTPGFILFLVRPTWMVPSDSHAAVLFLN